MDNHGDYLFTYAYSRVRNESIAEELVQETLLSAVKSLDTFAQHSSARTWLTGILKHKVHDHFRNSFRELPFSGDEADLSSYQYLFPDKTWKDHWSAETTPVEWKQTPEELLEKHEFWDVLSHCISELPTRVATAFVLHEMDGVGGKEICGILNVSNENYWVMLHRARTHLRRCLEYDWFRNASASRGHS